MEKTLKPALRFKGFTDTWEQYKLGDIGKTYTGLSGKTAKDFGHGTGKYVTYMNVFTNPISNLTNLEPIEIDNKQNEVRKGDIFFTTSSETPHEVGMSSVWLGDADNIYLNSFCFGYRPTVKNDSNFMGYILRSPKVRKDISLLAQGISRFNISKTKMMDNEISLPAIKEQTKIGELFRSLDNLITLHQRKHEKLINVKKALLDKMFPKNGELVPQLRFKGFTDTWEQRNIRELGKIFIGLVTTMTSNYTDKGTLLIRNSDIKENRFQFSDNPIFLESKFASDNSSRMLKIGDVVTVHTGDVGTSAVIGEKEENSIGFATINTRPKKDIINSDYLSCYFNTDIHKNFAVNMSTGDGRTNYNLKEFNQVMVPLPSVTEQQKVASLVLSVNNLITLHQRKYEKLVNIKRALLQKMFV